MNIAGVDLSLTGTGIALSGGACTIKMKAPTKANKKWDDEERRMQYIYDSVLETTSGAELIIIEGLAFASHTGKATERAGMWWQLKMAWWRAGVPVAVAPPTTVKKFGTGNGAAQKDAVMLAAALLMPNMNITNNNESDAALLFAMAKERVGESVVSVPAVNRAALAKVAWPEGL